MRVENAKLRFLLLGMISILHANPDAFAAGGIVTDGTVGSGKSFGVSQDLNNIDKNASNNLNISDDFGTRQGSNLFHSFKEFNILTKQTVTFQTDLTTDNVISRVTGSSSSDINGTLKLLAHGQGNFFLINPNGVTFGPYGKVDVPGSVHISTADYLKLKNGQTFNAVNPVPVNALYNAEPASFGFLGTSSANNGLLKLDEAEIAVNDSKAIDLVAGDITVKNNSSLSAPAGDIRLIARKGQGQVDIGKSLGLPEIKPSENNSGNITVENSPDSVVIGVSGNGGGKVSLWGNNISIIKENSIFADNTGPDDATLDRGISIHSHTFKLEDSLISSEAIESGNAGNISLTADKIDLLNGGEITSFTSAAGYSGSLFINADKITIDGKNNRIFSTGFRTIVKKNSNGKAGNISIKANFLDLLNLGEISSTTHSDKGTGNLIISVKNNLKIQDGGYISTSTSSQGNAGNIDVISDKIKIDGKQKRTGLFSESRDGGIGQVGNISVTTRILELFNNRSVISTSTFSDANAGNITIYGADLIRLNGIKPFKDDQPFRPLIASKSFGRGSASNVDIHTKFLELIHGGNISASTESVGKAGSIDITANNVIIQDGGSISSASLNTNSSGQVGDINLHVFNRLSLKNGAINISNEATELEKIIATSISPGTITINSKNVAMENSEISTRSDGNISAGGIRIKDGELFKLQNSQITTSVAGIIGNGGNIDIASDILVMESGLIQANTKADNGFGGNINLNLKALITSGNMLTTGGTEPLLWEPGQFGLNIIQAAAPRGLNGQINSSIPQLNLSGVLANLGPPQFETKTISHDYCKIGGSSSLTRKGKGGLLPKARESFVH